MKKLLQVLLVVCLAAMLCVTAFAEEVTEPVIIAEGEISDTLKWTLDEDGLLTFEGTGAIPNCSNDSQPWRIYMDKIKVLQISDGVTSVGTSAFYGYYNLETVTLGRGVTSVGPRAFDSCSKLTEITLSDAMDVANYEGYQYSFDDTPLRTVYVPATVTFIEDNFYNKSTITEFVCEGTGEKDYFDVDGVLYHKDDYTGVQTLVKVPHSMDLPDTLEVAEGTNIIGEKAVQDNSSFKWVDLPEGLRTIKGHAFEECDSLLDVFYSDGLTTIEDYAFHHCDRLLHVELPDSTTTIKADAFKECGWLYEVKLGRGVTSVGPRAFEACPNLTELTLSDAMDVANYEGYQYSFGDTPIQIVTVPATVTFIEDNFYNKSTITEFVCEGTGEKDYFDIDGVLYHKDDYTGIQTLVKAPHAMDLPDTFTVLEGTHIIGERAFIDNDSFAALVLCDGMQTIKANAFQECDGLLTIDFANGLTTIEDYAFHHCDSLLRIDLPDSTTTIKADAFKECGWLEEIKLGRGVTSVGTSAFEACPKLTEITLSDAMDVANYEGYNYSFDDTPIRTVHVPATVTFMEDNFYNKTSITEFVCEGTGESGYFDIDGVLYHKDPYTGTQTLVKAPHAMDLPDTFTVSDGTYIIGEKAVLENDSFTALILPEGLRTIKANAFQGCAYMETIDFADGLTTIGTYAFHHCDRLLRIDLPDTVITIEADAFKECGWLEAVKLGRGVTAVGPRAFESCPKLTEITLSDAMDVANYEGYNYSFGDTPIRTVHVPATVTFIENNFYNKSTITEFVCEGTGEDGYFDIDGVLYHKDKLAGTQKLLKVPRLMELPDTFVVYAGTTSIGDNAVLENDTFSYVRLPYGLLTIGASAFNNCDNLLYLEIPNTVTKLGDSAFYHCDWLSEAHIGSSVTSIGRSAFDTCHQLTHIFFRGDAPTSVGKYAFDTGAEGYALWYPENASGWTTPTWNYHPAYPYNYDGPLHPYRINSITVSTLSGETLKEIPTAYFHVTVAVTNQITDYNKGAILVAAYTADGRFLTWNYVAMEDCPAEATVKFTMPIDNRGGEVGTLRAFVTSGTGSMEPFGDAVEFTAK